MKTGFVIVLLIAAVPAFAQSRSNAPACASGEPWFLPAAPASGETAMLVVMGATTPLRIRLCNCAAKEDGQVFIRVNTNTATADPIKIEAATKSKLGTMGSFTSASQLYVGSCLEAVGNVITIRNTLQKDQRGTYQTRP